MKVASTTLVLMILAALSVAPSPSSGQIHRSSICMMAIIDCYDYGKGGSGCVGYSAVDCPGNAACTFCKGAPEHPLTVCVWVDDPNYTIATHCALLDQFTSCGVSRPGTCRFIASAGNPQVGICECLDGGGAFTGDCSFQNCEGNVP